MKRFIDTADSRCVAGARVGCDRAGRDARLAHGAWSEDEFENRPLVVCVPAAARQGRYRRQSDHVPDPEGRHAARRRAMVRPDGRRKSPTPTITWIGGRRRSAGSSSLPDEHILPDTPRVGIVMNIPEMRIYYYYPSPIGPIHPKARGKVTPAKFVLRQEALSGGVHAVGGLHVSGRSRPFRLEDAGGKFHSPRQDPQSDLGGARRHLRGASRA